MIVKIKPLKKINLFWMGDSTVDKKMIDKIRIIRKRTTKSKIISYILMLSFLRRKGQGYYLMKIYWMLLILILMD